MGTGALDRVGSTFGPYALRHLIGKGGMGEVYEAHDTRKDRVVALKLLPPALASDEEYRQRFRREAQIAARLQEPHVIPIHDFGEIDGILYIDMRLVRGTDLREVIDEHGRLEPETAYEILRQVADALDAAHADGLVHRDIKPANILLLPTGFAYLADFGIATRRDEMRLTTTGATVGSIAYMAPERFSDAELTGACDIYSLGCLLHEMLVGAPPFRRESYAAQVTAHLHEEPEPVTATRPELPAGIDAVVARAMAKDPVRRYRTASDLTKDLKRALGGTGGLTARRATSATDVPTAPRVAPSPGAPATPAAAAVAAVAAGPPSAPPGPTGPAPGYGPGAAYPVPPAPPPRRNRGMLAGLAVLALLVGAGGVALASGALDGDDRVSAPSSTSTASAPATQTAAPAATTTTTMTTTTTTSPSPTSTSTGPRSHPVAPERSTTSAPRSTTRSSSPSRSGDEAAAGPTVAPGPGYGWQGWTSIRKARCNADDRALLITGSATTRISICEVGSTGRTYYRGWSTSSRSGIELDDPRRTEGGWSVDNEGYTYSIGPDQVVIRNTKDEIILDETVTTWAEPSG